MAESESGQEKTEQPTAKKLNDAKQKGQVPRSKELNSSAIMFTGSAALLMMGPYMLSHLANMMKQGFSITRNEIMDSATITSDFVAAAWAVAVGIGPFLALMSVMALATPLLLGGWAFSTQAISFKADRLNPLSGFKRIFSAKGLMELVKALGKFLVVALFAWFYLWLKKDEFLGLAEESFFNAMSHGAWLFGSCFLVMSSSLILIAAIDVPFQLWDHSKKLKMTLQEVRDEMKETDGRPEVKSKIRSIQQEMAQRRMMEDVPSADVIITNPTHYSVALKYQPEKMAVPVIVAMGKDLMAFRIREVAQENEIEIFQAAPLARALFAHGKIGEEIPSDLYFAVAQVLAFVFQLQQAREQGLEMPERPDPYVAEDSE